MENSPPEGVDAMRDRGLDRAHVTQASRRTLPTYILFCLVVGGAWAFNPAVWAGILGWASMVSLESREARR